MAEKVQESRLARLTGLFLVWAICVGSVFGQVFFVHRYFEIKETGTWPSAKGTILKAEVTSPPMLLEFVGDVQYEYHVNNQRYLGNRVNFVTGPYRKLKDAEADVAGYSVGQAIDVFYNPMNPKEALLRPGISAAHLPVLFLPLFILCFCGNFLWKYYRKPQSSPRKITQGSARGTAGDLHSAKPIPQSWSLDRAPADPPEFDSLVKTLFPIAQKAVLERRAFFPLGAIIRPNGSLVKTKEYSAAEDASAAQLIAKVTDAFQRESAAGKVRSAGLCFETSVTVPGTSCQTAAICCKVEHISGAVKEVFLPYNVDGRQQVVFLEQFSAQGKKSFFNSPK